MDKERLTRPRSARDWTRLDDYVAALVHRRTARQRGAEQPRTQPDAPRFSLSTLPFLALLAALLVLSVAIIVAAWPGNQPQPKPKQLAQHEQGYAPKGWLQEAEKDMRR